MYIKFSKKTVKVHTCLTNFKYFFQMLFQSFNVSVKTYVNIYKVLSTFQNACQFLYDIFKISDNFKILCEFVYQMFKIECRIFKKSVRS